MPKGNTRKDANEKMGELEREVRQENYIPPKSIPLFSEVADSWLDSKKSEIRHTTHNQYNGHVENHLKPAFEYLKINQVSFDVIERFKAERLETGVTPFTLSKILTTLGQVLTYAVRSRYIDFNPAREVKKPKGDRVDDEHEEMVILQPKQIRALFCAAEDHWERMLFMAAVLTGMREGELLGLKWSDVNWVSRQVEVNRTYNHGQFYKPKSKASRRKIDMTPELVNELKKWKLACLPSDLDLVFPSGARTPTDAANMLKRRFFPALNRAKLPRIRFHDLRLTFAALVWDQTKDPKYLQVQLGHSSVQMTLDIYGHLMKKTNQEAATKLGAAVFGDDGSKMVAATKKEITPSRVTS
jgi:integrase